MAGTIGNKNAMKGAKALEALNAALEKRFGDPGAGLKEIWGVVIREAEKGESWACQEIIHRIGGKPKQAIIGGDEDDAPLRIEGRIKLVRPAPEPA